MNLVESALVQSRVLRADVHSVKSRDGFWTHLSELDDGSWLVEYDPLFQRRDGEFLVIGPYGPRERVPDSAPLANVGRVVLAVAGTQDAPCDERTARLLASTVSAHAATLPDLARACEAPAEPLSGVLYELLDAGESGQTRSGTFGTVERYGDGDVFRLETGDEVPLADVDGRLWPAGGLIDP